MGTIRAATDAAGYGTCCSKPACIGGWWATGPVDKHKVYWYSITIPRTEKWAYKKGSSQNRIAAIELMATLVLFKLIEKEQHQGATTLTTRINTDNQGNAYAVAKGSTRKWPASDVLLELQLTCHFSDAIVVASHVKREYNQWADALSKRDHTGFNPALRRHFDITAEDNWITWQTLKHTTRS